MKKIIETIKSWFTPKVVIWNTQDEINFDLEKFNLRFCKKCGFPFEVIKENQKYCCRDCRILFNNKKRKR